MTLEVAPAFRPLFEGEDFESCYRIEGETAKLIQNRATRRFSREGRQFYIKCHVGVGWSEIFKNLFRGCLPVTGAANEWRAIARVTALGISTTTRVAYGDDEAGPARRRSLLITEDIGPSNSLEQLTAGWADQPPPGRLKRVLIDRVAELARRLHAGGVNHRDFYLCHFLLAADHQGPVEEAPIYLIDLHRAQLRRRTPRRWVVKDLGGLYFSAMEIGLGPRDLLRFVRGYSGGGLKGALGTTAGRAFWQAVAHRAAEMHRRLKPAG